MTNSYLFHLPFPSRARLIALPLIQNAPDAGIKQEELHRTIDVIARAERMDKEIMLDTVRNAMKMMEENIRQFEDEE